jgi:hypothetical protein
MNRVMNGQTIIDEQVFIISHLIVINKVSSVHVSC